ncbi:trimethyllysine dioxygenase [Xylaria bambusicola]|uniref:trimethyllysine dioxygenase n=1 Tax=Xylaria bambusicola TaxID=326684 RepID=UPI0020075BAD|nr:trimethyllysine dioxygenase [Xylaria bambusicola]KAI0517651.1 trimethyllysine dioxygenase [Xylaria bambusicola]
MNYPSNLYLFPYSRPLRRYSVPASTSQASKDLWSSVRRVRNGLVFTSINEKTVPYIWLRDNCRCSSCVHQATRQRNFDIFELPEDIKPSKVTANEAGLEIQWSHESHTSFYSWDFLEIYIKGERPAPEDVPPEYFGAGGPSESNIEYGEFLKDKTRAVGRVTDMIKRKGLAFVTGVPTESADMTKKLLEMIAFIRVTHYGGFYEFEPGLEHADTAYTNEALPLHTDTTYFSDPCGLQSFHLLSHTDTSSQGSSGVNLGGQSLLLDGFHAAQILRKENPEAFKVLASFGLPFHASGDEGIAITPDKLYPVLECDSHHNMVRRIRWNKGDRAVNPLRDGTAEWYKAAAKWNEILNREELVYRFQLEPGKVLIFNNWRVLHGREAFIGQRRMCGGYINYDDWISAWRNTNLTKREVSRQVIGE